MTRTLVIPADSGRGSGLYMSTPIALPVGSTYLGVVCPRIGWEDKGTENVATFEIQVQLGSEWVALASCSADGRPRRGRDGTLQETRVLVRIPSALEGRIRRARVRLVTFGRLPQGVDIISADVQVPARAVGEHHSVTYDNDIDAIGNNVSSITMTSFTVGNRPNRAMVVSINSWDLVPATSVVTAVTFNGSGTGWSQIGTGLDASDDRASIWGLIAPAVVTGSVVVTFAATCNEVGACAISLWDVRQTNAFTGFATGAGTGTTSATSTATATDVTAADMVVDTLMAYGDSQGAGTVGADQTSRQNTLIEPGAYSRASTQPGTAGGVMTWSLTATANIFWSAAAVTVKGSVIDWHPRYPDLHRTLYRVIASGFTPGRG